jgi:hypothetical protein
MGTWAAGPFGNDAALDYVGGVLDQLMEPVREFLASPEIDETFDPAFAAIALMVGVMEATPSRPWDAAAKREVDPAPICAAMLTCFDEQIDSMEPDADFRRDQRSALVATLDRFAARFT